MEPKFQESYFAVGADHVFVFYVLKKKESIHLNLPSRVSGHPRVLGRAVKRFRLRGGLIVAIVAKKSLTVYFEPTDGVRGGAWFTLATRASEVKKKRLIIDVVGGLLLFVFTFLLRVVRQHDVDILLG